MKNTYDTCRYQINSFISLWVVAGWTSFFPGNLVHLSHLETRAQLISACVWAKSTPAVLTGFCISASGCCEQKFTLWLDTFFETRYFLLRTKHYLENNVKTSMVFFCCCCCLVFCYFLSSSTPVCSCAWASCGVTMLQGSTKHFVPSSHRHFHSPRESVTPVVHRPLDISVPNRFLVLEKSCIMSSWSVEVSRCPVIAPRGSGRKLYSHGGAFLLAFPT